MKTTLEEFKVARLVLHIRLTEINPSNIDSLTAFPFLTSEIQALKQELPLYQAAAQDVDPSLDLLIFESITKMTYQLGLKLLDMWFWYNHHQLPPNGFSLF